MHFSLGTKSGAALASFNILMSILNELIQTHPQFCRTIAVIHQNATSDLTTDIFLALQTHNASIVTVNFDRMTPKGSM